MQISLKRNFRSQSVNSNKRNIASASKLKYMGDDESLFTNSGISKKKLRKEVLEYLEKYNKFDGDNDGFLTNIEALNVFREIGKPLEDSVNRSFASGILTKNSKKVSFYEFLVIISHNDLVREQKKEPNNPQTDSQEHQKPSQSILKAEGNTRIIEYIRLLEEYERKCNSKGNFDEAKKVFDKISEIKTREMERLRQLLKSNQGEELFEIEKLQAKKMEEFNSAWEKYNSEFEVETKANLEKTKEKHEKDLVEFIERLENELQAKYQKPSTKLLNLRKQQDFLSKGRNFGDAARVKAMADALEMSERESNQEKFQREFGLRVESFKAAQEKIIKRLEFRINQEKVKHKVSKENDIHKLSVLNTAIKTETESKHKAKIENAVSVIREKFHFVKKSLESERLPKVKFTIPKDYLKLLQKKRSQSALPTKIMDLQI